MSIQEMFEQITERLGKLEEKVSMLQRPPDEQVLDDVELQKEAKVSQRTTATWRSKKLIQHKKIEGKVYYLKSWFLEAVHAGSIQPIWKNARIRK